MKTGAQKELTFYPWDMSATGDWSKEDGLVQLAEYAKGEKEANEIAEMLWEPGAYVQNSAVVELLGHGNVRQAAMLVRAIIGTHPVCEKTLREQFDTLIDDFTNVPLDRFPSKPAEYQNVKVRMIE